MQKRYYIASGLDNVDKVRELKSVLDAAGWEHTYDWTVHGSVQREGQNLRVTARLVDAASGRVIWTDQYDQVVSSLMELQDQITSAIVAANELLLTLAAMTFLCCGVLLWAIKGVPRTLPLRGPVLFRISPESSGS